MTKEMRNEVSVEMKGCIDAAKRIRDELLDEKVDKAERMNKLPIYKYILIANKNIVSAIGIDLMAERMYNTEVNVNVNVNSNDK